jgi:phage terminase large subunit-like protein
VTALAGRLNIDRSAGYALSATCPASSLSAASGSATPLREKFQGETLGWVWLDEEPPMDIYSEALTRTNIGANPVWMTFTPLLGMSEVVRRFLQERSDARHITSMTIDDVQHYSEEEKATIIASYPHMKSKRERRAFLY